MRGILSLQEFIRSGQELRGLSDEELIMLGGIDVPPDRHVEAIIEWAEKEAMPLLHELAFRFRAAREWFPPDKSPTITAEGLIVMGFLRSQAHDHPVYVRKAVDDPPGCHTSLHLLPDGETGWIAEIHNWQTTEDGDRECDVDQRAGLPRRLQTYSHVRRLCKLISDRWE